MNVSGGTSTRHGAQILPGMVRTRDRCIRGLGNHSAVRGQVCQGALQVLPDPCGSWDPAKCPAGMVRNTQLGKHWVAATTQVFCPKGPAGNKPAHRTANAVPRIALNSSMSAVIAMAPLLKSESPVQDVAKSAAPGPLRTKRIRGRLPF